MLLGFLLFSSGTGHHTFSFFFYPFIQVQDLERELNQVKEKNEQLQMQLAASSTSLQQNNDANNNTLGGSNAFQSNEKVELNSSKTLQ